MIPLPRRMREALEGRSAERSPDRIDWSQIWYPGPTRVFTAEEMARAGGQRPGRTLVAAALFNVALLAFVVLLQAPRAGTAAMTAILMAAGVLGVFGARALWRRPTRRGLSAWTLAASLGAVVLTVGTIEAQGLEKGDPLIGWLFAAGLGSALLMSSAWWFVAVYRAHQIEARLREIDEQQRALGLARQLTAAQIQPHFLFNSLASLQHWVQAKDDRAAPMLAALTGFLRATLPLFDRERLALGEEAEAVRQYLAVMQLRLGDRLRAEVDVAPAAAGLTIPPGVLLTLVENAIEHGVQPSLGGAAVRVRAGVDGSRLCIEVRDTGPGLRGGHADGVGLTNTRARLAQAHGPDARLTLDGAPGGGCVARIELPAHPNDPTDGA